MSEWQKDYWNTRAKTFGVTAPGYDGTAVHDSIMISAFDHILHYPILLDCGCGTGRLYETLTKHCDKYVGVDYSAEMLKVFQDHHKLRPQDSIHQADLSQELPFSAESFDAVVSSVTLMHIIHHDQLVKAISEIKRVLKINGAIYLCEAVAHGIPVFQPVKYQVIRPKGVYESLFKPEVDLEDHGDPLPEHTFFFGIKNKVEYNENEVVVDVGCGGSKVIQAVGLDRRRVYRHGQKITDVVGDARRLPFKSQSVDELWCSGVLEHFKNPYVPLLEIHRVIKPEGTVIIDLPYAGTGSAQADPDHKFLQDPDVWASMLGGFFGKVKIIHLGLRFDGSEKWLEWQRRLLRLGFYSMAQGGRFTCTKRQPLPEIRYVPWWLEKWVKQTCEQGENLV
jgi:ubiquinone/menaquinone biosynthesis C-methylase UbiE